MAVFWDTTCPMASAGREFVGSRPEALEVAPVQADVAKAMVLTYLAKLAANGDAAWVQLADNKIELRLSTGEIFILAEKTIHRVG